MVGPFPNARCPAEEDDVARFAPRPRAPLGQIPGPRTERSDERHGQAPFQEKEHHSRTARGGAITTADVDANGVPEIANAFDVASFNGFAWGGCSVHVDDVFFL